MLRFWAKQPSKQPFSRPSFRRGFQPEILCMKARRRGGGHVGPDGLEMNAGNAGSTAARGPSLPLRASTPAVGAPARPLAEQHLTVEPAPRLP